MKGTAKRRAFKSSLTILALLLVAVVAREAGCQIRSLKGQTVYVPAYSDIYHGDRELPFYLTVTLSVRNTDATRPITILSVDYFGTDGKLIKHYVEDPVKLGVMSSARYIVKESDKAGGPGASFIVKWKSETAVTAPVIEAVMIGTSTQQGISFTSRGQVVDEE